MKDYDRQKLHIRPFIPLKQLYEEAMPPSSIKKKEKKENPSPIEKAPTTPQHEDTEVKEIEKNASFFGYAKSMASTVSNIVTLVKKHYDQTDMSLAELLIGVKYYHQQKIPRKFDEYKENSIQFDKLNENTMEELKDANAPLGMHRQFQNARSAYLTLCRMQHHAFIMQAVSPKIKKDQFFKVTSVMLHWEHHQQDEKEVEDEEKQEKKQVATLLAYHPISTPERNGYALLLNHHTKELCLYINGTQSLADIFIDLNITPVQFMDGYAHEGMAVSSKWFECHLRDRIEELLREHTDYHFVIIGHSLGAGVAALLGLLLKPQYPNLHVVGFSAPKCVSPKLREHCQSFVSTFIYMDDVVPLMSLTTIRDLRRRVANTNWKHWVYNDVDSSRPTKWLKGYSTKFSHWWHQFGAENCYERTDEQLEEESKESSSSIPLDQVMQNPGYMYYIRVVEDVHYLCIDQDLISKHLSTLEFNRSYIRHHYCDSYYMGLSCLCSQITVPDLLNSSHSIDSMLHAEGLPYDHLDSDIFILSDDDEEDDDPS